MTITAQWTPNTYTYSFDANGGTAVAGGEYTSESPDIVLPIDITREGYVFSHWVVKETSGSWVEGTPVSSITAGNFGNVTFKAIWSNDDYTVTYNGANITGEPLNAEGDTEYIGTVNAATGYHLEDEIEVKVGNVLLTRDTDFTYTLAADSLTAQVKILGEKIINNITITAVAAEHKYTDHYVHNLGTDTHTAYCACGATEIQDCSGGTATCIEKAVCDLCGGSYGGFAAHKAVTVGAKTETCTAAGNVAYTYCEVCGLLLSIEENDVSGNGWYKDTNADKYTIVPMGHNFSGQIRDNGNGTHSYKCLNGCGLYGATVGHTFDRTLVERIYQRSNATCESPALYYYSCDCGAKGTTTFMVGTALGHAWVSKAALAPTCVEGGHSAYEQCSRCDATKDLVTTPALGHGDYALDTTRSGKQSDGTLKYDYYKCSRCDDYYILLTVMVLDQNGNPINGADVELYNRGIHYTSTTDASGEVKFAEHFKDGDFKINLSYRVNSVLLTTSNTVKLNGGSVNGSVGRIDTSLANNNGGSSGGSGGFRCSMCDMYEAQRKVPVYGWFITIIHTFVHTIQRLIHSMSR